MSTPSSPGSTILDRYHTLLFCLPYLDRRESWMRCEPCDGSGSGSRFPSLPTKRTRDGPTRQVCWLRCTESTEFQPFFLYKGRCTYHERTSELSLVKERRQVKRAESSVCAFACLRFCGVGFVPSKSLFRWFNGSTGIQRWQLEAFNAYSISRCPCFGHPSTMQDFIVSRHRRRTVQQSQHCAPATHGQP